MKIDEQELNELVVSERKLFQGKVFDVDIKEVELPNGNIAVRELIRHNGGAAIVAIDNDLNLFMIEQYRISFESVMSEIPAGKCKQGEDPLVCAKRELQEETGCTADNWLTLHEVYPSPGYLNEVLTIFLATDLTEGVAKPDQDEFMNCRKVPFAKAYEAVLTGEINDAKTIIGILLAHDYLEKGLV